MSVLQYQVVEMDSPNRNGFDMSYSYSSSCNMGDLVPCFVKECIPGDNWTLGGEALVRFSPLVAPVMHRFDVRIEYFFVPNRLVWNHWNNFLTYQPGDIAAPAGPYIDISNSNYTQLMDWMGIPTPDETHTERVNAMPFACFQLIYDQYYRPQYLMPSVTAGFTLNDGNNTANIAAICAQYKRCWEHDTFTSCLPTTQLGAPVTVGGTFNNVRVLSNNGDGSPYSVNNTVGGGTSTLGLVPAGDVTGPIYAETSQLDLNLTINELRLKISLQRWAEKNMRAGTRINEVIKSHFNVDPGDARVQRPEYIVGIKDPIQISEVLNTAGLVGDDGSPQGTMAGHGVTAITDPNFGSYFCREHGFIIGILSVMPKTAYQQGLEKHWQKHIDVSQYYWPDFAGIGEQPLLNKEIYAFQDDGNDTFGYLPPHYDYRCSNSVITGQFRNTLSHWTCSRIFDGPPALNLEFLQAVPRKDIFAVTDPNEDCIFFQVLNKAFANRPIPMYGTPGIDQI